MPLRRTSPPPLDPFLSGDADIASAAVNVASEALTENGFSLAELSVAQAQDAIFLVPADEVAGRFALAGDVVSAFRAELHSFFRYLKERGQLLTELLSVTSRDQAVRQLSQNMLDAAYGSPSRSWMVGLPTGRQFVIVPSALVATIGPDRICNVAHERSIRAAQSAGQPFNAQALAHYQSIRPSDVF